MSSTEWLELESDPGLFTLLLEDFGVKGVQVEEIYDLSKPITETVYGFIFLFRWDNPKKKANRRSGRGSANSSASLLTTPGTTTTTTASTTACANISTGTANATHDSTRTDRDGVSTRLRSTSGSTVNSHTGPAGEHGHGTDSYLLGTCPEPTELFFARQTVQNSCATHALLSILLNRPELDLGPMLSEFQKATRQLSPEAKGTAIGSMPQLAQAHNRHATQPLSAPSQPSHSLSRSPRLEPSESAAAAAAAALALTSNSSVLSGTDSTCALSTVATSTTTSSSSTTVASTTAAVNTIQLDTFHFVCYVPFGGFLYELDGLKPDPINHGPLADPNSPSDWTRQCADILRERMQEQDVRYSLMAVVPDRRLALTKRMYTLDKNRQIIEDTLLRIARFEEARKQGSIDFSANVVNTDSPSSVPDHQPNVRVTQSTVSGPDEEKELTPSDTTSGGNMTTESVFAADDLISADSNQHQNATQDSLHVRTDDNLLNKTHNTNRSIRTRSLTRANAVGETVAQLDGDTQADVVAARAAPRPSSPTVSDVVSSQARKRSPTSTVSNPGEVDEATTWVSERKRRLMMTTTTATDEQDDCVSAGGDTLEAAGSVPYSQTNKMLASIVSVESPLLTTLTEMVAAAAQVVSDTLDESASATYRAESPTSNEGHRSDWEPRGGGTVPRCTKVESDHRLKSEDHVKAVSNQASSLDTNHRSFGSTYMPSESDELPSELTKPLTVDTQLWDRARPAPADRLESDMLNGSSVLPVLVGKSEDAAPIEAREFRPQTRALTRARVKTDNHSAGLGGAKSTDCYYSSTGDSAEQPSSSTSPTTMDSPGTATTTTRSPPQSPPSDHEHQHPMSMKREPNSESHASHTSDDPLTTALSESGSFTGVPSSGATSNTATTTVASDASARRASKYPTRSSTKRDTLASHSLANCRTSAPTTSITTAASVTCSTSNLGNHVPGSLRPNLSSSNDVSTTVCFETKIDPREFKSGLGPVTTNNHHRPRVHIPRFTADELRLLLSRVKEQAKLCDDALLEEEEKRQTYRVDDARRVHNYEPFIRAYLTALSQHGLLHNLVVQAVQHSYGSFGNSSSFLLLSPNLGATGSRKSSSAGGNDHTHHPRRSDADRSSASGPKGNLSGAIDRTINMSRLTPTRTVEATGLSSPSGVVGSTRRGLRARGKRNFTVSVINPAPSDSKNADSREAEDERGTDYVKRTVGSPELRGTGSTEFTTTASATVVHDSKAVASSTSDRVSCINTEAEHSIINNETPGPATRSKPLPVSPSLSNIARNGTLDVSETSSGMQGPLSPLASSVAHTSYSSCGSAPQSPQSSTSSRSTYLRPQVRQTARSESAKSVAEDDDDGFISRKSLRPRSSADRSSSRASQPGLSDSSDEPKSGGGGGPRLLLRRRTYSSLVKHVDSSGPCKPGGPTANPFSTAFSQRFRKRRLC